MDRYEFGYTDESGNPMRFGLHGVSMEVAKAVRSALKKLEQNAVITNVTADRITETREAVTGPVT